MKEFLFAAAICGVVAYILCQPSTTPQLEQSEKTRAVENGPRAGRPVANNPAPTGTAAPAEGSLTSRWQAGSSSSSATPAASNGSLDNRWKPRP